MVNNLRVLFECVPSILESILEILGPVLRAEQALERLYRKVTKQTITFLHLEHM